MTARGAVGGTIRAALASRALRTVWLVVLALLLAACSGEDSGKGKGAGGPPAVVTTTVLAAAPWTDSIEALGTASARESVSITAKVSETVAKVSFDSGDVVRAGDVLVTLSGNAQLAALDEASADYREALKLYERQKSLAERQLIPASQMDLQRALRDAAKGRLDQIQAQLADRVISAPFDGVLGLRQVSPGSLVTPGTVIATLDDVSRIKLDFSVPERNLCRAVHRPGSHRHQRRFSGRAVSRRDHVGRLARGSGDARVGRARRIRQSGQQAAPGHVARGRSCSKSRARRCRCRSCRCSKSASRPSCSWSARDDKVAQVPVRIGARRPGWVEILEGVKAGDRVVVEGMVKLKPGAKIAEAEAAPDDGGTRKTVGRLSHAGFRPVHPSTGTAPR